MFCDGSRRVSYECEMTQYATAVMLVTTAACEAIAHIIRMSKEVANMARTVFQYFFHSDVYM